MIIKYLSAVCLFSALTAVSNFAFGQAHVHGSGKLLIAQENEFWHFQFVLPAADLLGFEHAPENEQQKTLLTKLIEEVEQAGRVLSLPDHCELTNSEHSLSDKLSRADLKGSHHEDEKMHEHSHHGKHNHEHEHKNHDHDDESSHADVEISYQYECKQSIENAQINIFALAPSLQNIDAQWVLQSSQGAARIDKSQPVLQLGK